jgi:hypothetical protein
MRFGAAPKNTLEHPHFGGTFPQKTMWFYERKLSHFSTNCLFLHRYRFPVVSTIQINDLDGSRLQLRRLVIGARIRPAVRIAQIGPALVGGGRMDWRDIGARRLADASQGLRGKRFREHFSLSYRPCHTGTRFSMKAPMPS